MTDAATWLFEEPWPEVKQPGTADAAYLAGLDRLAPCPALDPDLDPGAPERVNA